MGLAEPRKRVKISHDPRNLQWALGQSASENGGSTTTSFGRRLMQQQGWQQGQALGARPANSNNGSGSSELDAKRLATAKVGVIIKDDTLGLGAQLRSKDVAHQKTGLDAFQGLLGRLNGKGGDEEEQEKREKKEGDRKLEMYTRGRWGGMIFIRGGVLVQGEEFKKAELELEHEEEEGKKNKKSKEGRKREKREGKAEEDDEIEEKKKIKEKRRKEKKEGKEKKERKEEDKKETENEKKEKEKKRRRSSIRTETTEVSADDNSTHAKEEPKPVAQGRVQSQPHQARNGRHILRGRNIEAKRKAFTDLKGLDAIFMRTTTTTTSAAETRPATAEVKA